MPNIILEGEGHNDAGPFNVITYNAQGEMFFYKHKNPDGTTANEQIKPITKEDPTKDFVDPTKDSAFSIKGKDGINYQIGFAKEFGKPTLYRRHVKNGQWVYEASINIEDPKAEHWQPVPAQHITPQFVADRFSKQHEPDPARWEAKLAGQATPNVTVVFDGAQERIIHDANDGKFYKIKADSQGKFAGNAIEITENPARFSNIISGKSRTTYQLYLDANPTTKTFSAVARYRDNTTHSWKYFSKGSVVQKWSDITDTWGDEHIDVRFPWELMQEYPILLKHVPHKNSHLNEEQAKCIEGFLKTSITELIKSCDSPDQYYMCLHYLINGGQKPQPLSAETSAALDKVSSYLTPKKLHELRLNGSTGSGHLATLGEARHYVITILQSAFKEFTSESLQPLNINTTGNWNHLCYSGETKDMMIIFNSGLYPHQLPPDDPRNKTPLYDRKEVSNTIREKSAELLQTIAAVYNPLAPKTVKDGASLQALQKARTALQFLCDPKTTYESSFLIKYSFPFLCSMAREITEPKGSFESARDVFLLPLYQSVQQKIQQLKQTQQAAKNAPSSDQFQILHVDQFKPKATHVDFLNEQFKNPGAIFVIPDNFQDANLPLNKRHSRSGMDGLAEPMAPRIVGTNPAGDPIYDLRTLGIPTGGTFSGTPDDAKKEVIKHFANLYKQLKLGATVVVPFSGGVPAFGTGLFADQSLTKDVLKKFIQDQFEIMKAFCSGSIVLNQLDPAYQTAWNNPGPALPEPKIQRPQERVAPPSQEGGLQSTETDLTAMRFRQNFREWFTDNGLGELAERTDPKDQTRSLHGTLSTGVGITIHKNVMSLDKSVGTMSEDDLYRSLEEMVELYIKAFHPDRPPPTTPLGNDKEKEILRSMLERNHVPIKERSSSSREGTPIPPVETGRSLQM